MKMNKIFSKYSLPTRDFLFDLLDATLATLDSEPSDLRPKDTLGSSGALLRVGTFSKTPIPSIIVPDLHARTDFFTEILNFKLPCDVTAGESLIVRDALAQGKLFLICLGDGFHGERRVIERWLEAQQGWLAGNILNKAMCAEMSENLALMTMVMETKRAFPNYFHFLKGNHENILNELGRGNYPFRKFASEGEMVKEFMQKLYDKPLVEKYANFEHHLPLFAYGSNFLVSHAEPTIPFSQKELINGLLDEIVVLGLTWTSNGGAQDDSVQTMLAALLPHNARAMYFAGHRSIQDSYRLLHEGKFIQIHNPDRHLISLVRPDRAFDPDIDIYDTSCGEIAQHIGENTNG